MQIRLDGSNNEPDARNDSAVTVVGKPITLNALANDTDPDGDPLTVAAAPTLISPEGVDPSTYTATLSDDGQFFFVAAQPGQYLFRYGDHRRQRERHARSSASTSTRSPTTARRSPCATTSRSVAAARAWPT